jgi:hypothetical protein
MNGEMFGLQKSIDIAKNSTMAAWKFSVPNLDGTAWKRKLFVIQR